MVTMNTAKHIAARANRSETNSTGVTKVKASLCRVGVLLTEPLFLRTLFADGFCCDTCFGCATLPLSIAMISSAANRQPANSDEIMRIINRSSRSTSYSDTLGAACELPPPRMVGQEQIFAHTHERHGTHNKFGLMMYAASGEGIDSD